MKNKDFLKMILNRDQEAVYQSFERSSKEIKRGFQNQCWSKEDLEQEKASVQKQIDELEEMLQAEFPDLDLQKAARYGNTFAHLNELQKQLGGLHHEKEDCQSRRVVEGEGEDS